MSALPIPDITRVKEVIYTYNGPCVFICPDVTCGRPGKYNTFALNHETGQTRVIGRECPLKDSRRLAREYLDESPPYHWTGPVARRKLS